MVDIAEQIARKVHAGQVEKDGAPYIGHVERVVARVQGDDAKMVAWLHDVIEDGGVTSEELEAAGIPVVVVQAVLLLTRRDESYGEYIEMIRAQRNPLALVVKIADLQDHLREDSQWTLPISLQVRYERALFRLQNAGTTHRHPKWPVYRS